MHRWLPAMLLVLLGPPTLLAQDSLVMAPAPPLPTPQATLSLDEALSTAREKSPVYRQAANNAGPARWAVRNAYGNLLPSVSASGGIDYTGAGQSNFGQGFTRATSALIGSSYQLGLQWQLDGTRLTAPAQQKANQQATDEEISNQESLLRFGVTTQYLTAMQAAAQVLVARQQVDRNLTFLQLASARLRVGQGTLLDVRQAEVQKGQSDLALLRAVQASNEAKLELFRQMGVAPPVSVELVALADSFPVEAPVYDLDQLIQTAEDQNPSLRSLRAQQHAFALGVRSAKTEFFPSLSVRAGWSGFTQELTDQNLLLSQTLAGGQSGASSCIYQDSIRTGLGFPGVVGNAGCYAANGLDASGTALDPAVRAAALDQNNVFPFSFTSQPFSASLTISLPIFTGFGRTTRLSQARANEEDAAEAVRARELQLRSDINSRLLALSTSFQAVKVQSANRDAARDQLRLAQDRYRVGSGNSLEVSDAQNAVTKAEGDYVTAIYDYHKALASLEAAVGRPLR